MKSGRGREREKERKRTPEEKDSNTGVFSLLFLSSLSSPSSLSPLLPLSLCQHRWNPRKTRKRGRARVKSTQRVKSGRESGRGRGREKDSNTTFSLLSSLVSFSRLSRLPRHPRLYRLSCLYLSLPSSSFSQCRRPATPAAVPPPSRLSVLQKNQQKICSLCCI